MFPSRYNAARHEDICKYRPSDAQSSTTKETGIQTSAHLQPSTSLTSRISEPSAVNVDAAVNANVKFCDVDCRGMTSHHSSGDEEIDYIREQIFTAADLILKVSRVGNKKLAEEVLRFLRSTRLRPENYQKILQNIPSCEKNIADRVGGKCKALQIRLGNVTCVTRSGLIENHLFNYRDTRDLIQKQLCFARDHQVILRPCMEQSAIPHALQTRFCNDVYGSVRNYVQRSAIRTAFWNDCSNWENPSFVGMVQVYTDKTATTFKSNAIVPYPVHVVLLNFIPSFRRFLIDNGYTFAGLLPVCTSTDEHEEREEQMVEHKIGKDRTVVPLSDALPARMIRDARTMKLQVLHDAMRRSFNH